MVLALSMAGTLGREAGRLVEDVLSRCSTQGGKCHSKDTWPWTSRGKGSRKVSFAPFAPEAHSSLLPIQGTSTAPHRQSPLYKTTPVDKDQGKTSHSTFTSRDETCNTDEHF